MNIKEAVVALKEDFPDMEIDRLTGPDPASLSQLIFEAEKYPKQIETCGVWLSECTVVKKHRTTHDTYRYKHEVEALVGHWVSHTSFLVAVRMAGMSMVCNPARPWAGLLPLGANRPGAMK